MPNKATSEFGELAGKIAGEVAAGLVKKAAPAVKKAAKAVEDKVDDWGWKGGKPGEMTGTDFTQGLNMVVGSKGADKIHARASKQISNAADKGKLPASLANNHSWAMREFTLAENAGIPRKWTGKVVKSLNPDNPVEFTGGGIKTFTSRSNDRSGNPDTYNRVSKMMRAMTNEQRDTFVKLLPEWEGSLDDLANAAKSL